MKVERRQFEVRGIVQGVGFRPFVYRLALSHGLKGFVRNESSCVRIDVEGDSAALDSFEALLPDSAPPLARISGITSRDLKPAAYHDFRIEESGRKGETISQVPPDAATCEACVSELFDPADRRFGYPFINCTDCGPRYTIILSVPYDRPFTTMAGFRMCPDCRKEYENPSDRRFHAQPNACRDCGPSLRLCSPDGSDLRSPNPPADAAAALAALRIAAVKGIGGFHLACDARSAAAVARLRERKKREEKPFAVMARDMQAVERIAVASSREKALLRSPERPIVLLRKKDGGGIAESVAPGNRFLGVMMPYSPLHHLLLSSGPEALVMTSGNLSDEPIAFGNDEALSRLGGIADVFLLHDRDIETPADDSVSRVVAGRAMVLRRSRGYVPAPVFLESDGPDVIGLGADLKNTVCVCRGNAAFLSQHLGDLENLKAREGFAQAARRLIRLLDARPAIVAHDMHPGYASSRHAAVFAGAARIPVQHHHAHVASVMAENMLEGRVIGVAFDGTGFGTDGTIWGGEFLVAGYEGFERAAHFRTVRMPGSDAAARQGWRMALSHANDALGDRGLGLAASTAPDAQSAEIAAAMMKSGLNSPWTSSLGRLFDAVAAVCGIRTCSSFEGQAAMALEGAASDEPCEPLPFAFEDKDGRLEIDTRPLFAEVCRRAAARVPAAEISRSFHDSITDATVQTCLRIGSRFMLDRVALSGGCFQNALLLDSCLQRLANAGFKVYSHCLVPPNDGGISLGQVAVVRGILRFPRTK